MDTPRPYHEEAGQATVSHELAGLGVPAEGYTLHMNPTQLEWGKARELHFAIEEDGAPVTEFGELHERRLHLIVVRRDGTGFRHLHPEMNADAAWAAALRDGDLAFLHVHPEEGHGVAPEEIAFEATFPTAGRYRLYLQFEHEGAVRTAEFTVVVPR